MIWLGLAAGLMLLLGGGEALVKGGVGVATHFRISPLLVGLVLVGFGTSTPELVASIEAAVIGAPGIAFGNIVGSNIANILLIMGISAVILPMATTKRAFRRDGAMLLGASAALLAIVLVGGLTRWAGVALLALLGAYTVFTYFTERHSRDASAMMHAAEAADVAPRRTSLALAALLTLGGMAAVVFGADLLVRAAIDLAGRLGLSDTVIGLTVVAIGTSLPELATSLMAALRRHGDVAFGNIVGSNIFNILGIGGAVAILSPFGVPPEIVRFDIWVMLAATVLLIVFAMTGWRINRAEGAVLVIAYAVYTFAQFSPAIRGSLGLV